MKTLTYFFLRWFFAFLLFGAARTAWSQTDNFVVPEEQVTFAWASDVPVGQNDPAIILLFFYSPEQVFDESLLDESTFDDSDLTVVGPDGSSRSAAFVRLASWADFLGLQEEEAQGLLFWEGILAIYQLPPSDPTVGWSVDEIGYYTIKVEPLQIYWRNGLPLKSGPVGGFTVYQAVETPPSEQTIPSKVVVTVEDDTATAVVTLQLPHPGFDIEWGAIEQSQLTLYPHPLYLSIQAVEQEGLFPQVVTTVSHTYTIAELARGTYSLTVFVNDVYSSSTQFQMGEPDPAPVEAWLDASPLVDPGQAVLPFTITYMEPVGREGVEWRLPEAIKSYVVTVIRPDGSEQVARLVDIQVLPTAALSPTYQAQYELAAPNGDTWTEKDNGWYPVYVDFHPQLDSPADPAVGRWDFLSDYRYLGFLEVIIYSGTPSVKASLTAYGDEGSAKIWVSVQFQPPLRAVSDWGTPIVGEDGTILINAVSAKTGYNGSNFYVDWWWYNDYVYYLESLAPGQYTARFLLDNVELASATFSVSANDRPMVMATVSDIQEVTVGDHQIVVEYVVPRGLDESSLDDFDLSVSGFNDGVVLTAKYVGEVQCNTEERCLGPHGGILGVYSIATADGTWDVADNGYYSIVLLPDAVFDQTGEALPATYLGSFAVLIQKENPPSPPSSVPLAVAEADNLYVETTDPLEFRIIFVDQDVLDLASIQKAAVTVERVDDQTSGFQLGAKAAHYIDALEKDALPVEVLSVRALDEDATVVEARYRLAGPGGSWNKADNGRYFIKVAEKAVLNKAGAAFPGGIVGQFLVLIQPLFVETVRVNSTWSFNGKIGYVDMSNYPWVFQADHGWWWFANITAEEGETVDGDWAWDGRAGWLYLSGDFAPWIYSAEYQTWLWHLPGSKSPRWFWASAREAWLTIE